MHASQTHAHVLTTLQPWPIIERFLQGLPDGAIGLDIGCGNGKYLAVNPKVFMIASDRSTNLAAIATQHQPHAALVADALALPHHEHAFDFAISIAVVHHLSTPERRINAVRTILDTLIPVAKDGTGGKALIYVWALEQKDSRRGWDKGHEQDVMVPWVMKVAKDKPRRSKQTGTDQVAVESSQGGDRTFHRYYHLYREGELEQDIASAGGQVVEAGYEKDNWWAIAQKGPG